MAKNKHVIGTIIGMTPSGWAPVLCAISECRGVRIYNPDLVQDVLVCTATTGPTRAISPGGEYPIELSSAHVPGFAFGEVICYVQGSGQAPVVTYEA